MAAWESFYRQLITLEGYKNVLTGLLNTAYIAVFGLLIGMIIGCLLATAKILPQKKWYVKTLSRIADVYIALFRGTPMVVQLLIIHFVLFPAMGIMISSVLEAIIAFGLNSGAYVAEIFRGGIMSIDNGQFEAGRSLGFNYFQTMIYIVIPQVIKNILPTLCNEFIVLLKETSIAGYVGIMDLTKAGDLIRGVTFSAFMPLIAVALIYLTAVVILTQLVKLLERRLRRSER